MRRWRSASEREAELNVVPMMNLFVVLVPLLLLSAVFVQVAAIELGTAGDASDSPAEDRRPTITVTEAELRIARRPGAGPETRIPRDRSDSVERLGAALADLRLAVSDAEIIIAATAGVRYQDLIAVIDTATAAGFSGFALAGHEETGHAR